MCSKCIATGVHRDHKFSSLSDLFESEQNLMMLIQEQIKETMRAITSQAKKMDDEDVRLAKSYQQVRSHIENFFRSVHDLATDRERTLIEQVDSNQAELIGTLKTFYSDLDAAEKKCQHWLERKREVIERLKNNDISATGEYNVCMAGLKQAQQAVKELNAQLVEILQRPPVITFTCDDQQADELKKAIENLGEFDKHTTTTFEEPEKFAFFDIKQRSASSSSNHPDKAAASEVQAAARKDETVLAEPTVITYLQMKDPKEMSEALPTRACVDSNKIIVSEEGVIRCLQSGRLTKKITKVGKNKLKRPEAITYYRQKEKFLIVDSVTKKLIKVKPDTGKTDEVDLPHIFAPGDIAITTGPNPTIFITDTQSICVFKYSTNGAYQGTIPITESGVKRPVGIAYMAGFLYIADVECHCIFKFDTEGMFIGRFGRCGGIPSRLKQPYGITALPGDRLAITEMGNHRISVFDSEGKFVQSFGEKGRDHGMFNMPKGISADSSHLVVVDYGNKRIQVISLEAIIDDFAKADIHDYETCN